ncbi:glycosyltransferase family protein [Nonlabens xiamenensis]|uniref:glycosyl transferase family 1 n=1 Tax=Nonlabens xiamenensis TaxID=2341043 RepID=UPI000F60F2DB|nr:glycosyl transferase family 1 [Nonlabens xiamenensis]
MKKDLLVVAYYWPPAGGPGVQRWLNFCKYLPDLGYRLTLVIPKNPDYPITDLSLNSEVPTDIKIIQVPIMEPSRWLSSLSRKRTKDLQRGLIQKKQGAIERLSLWIRGNFFIPDARVGWKKAVIKATESYVEQHPSATVITTGPPHSLHLIGLTLKHKHQDIKWLADFRDPWTTIGYHKQLKLGTTARKKHLRLEQQVLDQTDRLIVTSTHTAREFASKTSTPVDVITNGFDIPINTASAQPEGDFVLSHVGTLLSERNPEVLWECLSELTAENEDFASDFKLKLAGNLSDTVIDSIGQHGLFKYADLLGYLPHTDSVRLMFESQALLLIEIDSEDTKAIIPGKIFEYLASRRPIIAIGPAQSDMQAMIKNTSSGQYFGYENKQGLKAFLIDIYKAYKKGKNDPVTASSLAPFHRKNLTQQLSQSIQQTWE